MDVKNPIKHNHNNSIIVSGDRYSPGRGCFISQSADIKLSENLRSELNNADVQI